VSGRFDFFVKVCIASYILNYLRLSWLRIELWCNIIEMCIQHSKGSCYILKFTIKLNTTLRRLVTVELLGN
jgi:hypothetical protein